MQHSTHNASAVRYDGYAQR